MNKINNGMTENINNNYETNQEISNPFDWVKEHHLLALFCTTIDEGHPENSWEVDFIDQLVMATERKEIFDQGDHSETYWRSIENYLSALVQ